MCRGSYAMIPLNFMDKWIEKTKHKLQMDPNYYYKKT